ncbi:hypothetical protein [Hymenobacter algoricola]|uniref:Lipocalin-like domain-containing protein n=1 Tax=Hymenobacter algoricola TaxID=486267 RepID=A0ABP7NYG6_9BACT
MFTSRTLLPLFTLLFGLLGFLSGCNKDNDSTSDPAPEITLTALTTAKSWRLDEIKQNNQTSSSGTGIKDRYTFTFRADGSYTQTLLADNTTYPGVWMLMSNNTMLHLVDHKGDSHAYTLTGLTAQQLRYRWTNKENKLEEFVFSAQP